MRLSFQLTLLSLLSIVTADTDSSDVYGQSLWSGWGGGILNNRWAPSSPVNSKSLKTLKTTCQIQYPQGISATPVVSSDNVVYYPTWNGSFVAANYKTCKTIWSANVSAIITEYGSLAPAGSLIAMASRTSPQIDEQNNIVYFGTQMSALVVALDRKTGATLGTVQLNPHPMAIITSSPTLFRGTLYVGASSSEEAGDVFVAGYKCCSFYGNMAAVTFSRSTGKFHTVWNTTMIPISKVGTDEWSGVGVWGGQPSIDPTRNQIFIATGNTYKTPQSYDQCQNSFQSSNTTDSCLPKDIWQESLLALDMSTGKPNWVRQLTPLDAWTLACGLATIPRNTTNCPQTPGPDADFGLAPTFIPASLGASTPQGKDTLLAGQKNGILWALDAETGDTLWSTPTSPGGNSGGISWGIAADKQRVYFNAINSASEPWTLQPSGVATTGSGYGAVDMATGRIVWETSAPGDGLAFGPPSVVGDLMLTTKPAATALGGLELLVAPGGLVVLDKATGNILQTVTVDAAFHGGTAVQGLNLLFGTGYSGYNSTGSLYVMAVS
jgi:outer membrane protein assembly factor BamB